MQEEKAKEEKLVGPNWMPKDDFRLTLDADDKDNPRLLLNLPARSGFVEITETDPPFVIVVARADNVITAKGILAHAKDMLFLLEHKINKIAALTLGVAAASQADLKGKTLTAADVKKKLTEGVH